MADTWGISGQAFLVLYGVLICAPVVIGLLWRFAQTRRDAPDAPNLTVYHLAYLAGGTRRVAETAAVRLLDAGQLRIGSTGTFSRVKGAKFGEGPVERAVLNNANRKRLSKVVEKLRPVVSDMNAELAGAGLAVPEAAVHNRRRMVFALSVLVATFGVVRLVTGLERQRPIGWLVVELCAAVSVAVVIGRMRRRGTNLPTAAGRRVLRQAKVAQKSSQQTSSPSSDHAAMVLAGAGVAGAVVFGGIALYPDDAVQSALAYVPPGGGGSAGGGYSSGGSSCSSGSSCGGGGSSCGGGGGCGGGGCGG